MREDKNMCNERIYFRGFLTNVDASILQVKLKHGFKTEAIPEKAAVAFFCRLHGLSDVHVYSTIFMEFPYLNHTEKKLYVVSNSFESHPGLKEKGLFVGVSEFRNEHVLGYLDNVIRLMRLFKEGDLRLQDRYYYYMENNMPKGRMQFFSRRYVSREPYHLEESELPILHEFIENMELPFTKPFLQLAFDNFELSYETSNLNLSFLALMVSLESLFNPGEYELRYRISRNGAVLLGKDREDSRKIFSKIKELYDKRSRIVHTGKSNVIKKTDLLKLRHYVRESIKEIYRIGKDKDELLDILNSCGFGEDVIFSSTNHK